MRFQRLFVALTFAITFILTACSAAPTRTDSGQSQIVFLCQHGNVKSLMAATYFNEIASNRNLPYWAISRGTAIDSDTAPPAIFAGLSAEGFDVSRFHPTAITSADYRSSSHAVLIGVALPSTVSSASVKSYQWADVPPASINYAATRDTLKSHIAELLNQLEHDKAR